MTLCAECQEAPAMRRYRLDGREVDLCQDCAVRIPKGWVNGCPLLAIGPAGSLESRVDWAKEQIRLAVGELSWRTGLVDLLRLLPGLPLEPKVYEIACEEFEHLPRPVIQCMAIPPPERAKR